MNKNNNKEEIPKILRANNKNFQLKNVSLKSIQSTGKSSQANTEYKREKEKNQENFCSQS